HKREKGSRLPLIIFQREPPALSIRADSHHIRAMVKTPAKKSGGFEEAPQAEFTGAPLTGPISDWAGQIAEEASKPSAPSAKKKKVPERSAAASRTARGTSMGGAASAKERAAAGLMPVAGMDVSLEDAEQMASSGVTATVAALSALIE